ncbi:MAG: alpha/beta hydrolase [Candidatus Eisenbacteria bacterium]|uniref:Alpha/beta hydrolase n=1 Tax=Eiseniibacteriota bacterium TaxID=2212470 RepID=A0A849SGT3_UNCEI|nr:alpha/beta hydrolase [Candidatus Eisenbacteria bacterium]
MTTPPPRPPLLMLNGVYGAEVHFDSLREELASDFPSRAMTFRRDGLPDPTPERGFGPVVERLHSEIERLGGAPLPLLGFSLGGALALEYALAHPERLSALVLINAYDRYRGSRLQSSTLPLLREWPAAWTNPPLMARVVVRVAWLKRGLFHPAAPRQVIERGMMGAALTTQDDVRFQIAHVALPGVAGIEPRLAALAERIPVMLVSSRDDAVVPPAHTQRLAASMPAAHCLPPFEGGHAFFQHDAAALAAEVRRFLARHASDGTNA